MVENESASELDARRALERHLGERLLRVIPDDRPSPDYWLPAPGSRPDAFEVKVITSSEWRQLQDAQGQQDTSLDTPVLTRRWQVLVNVEVTDPRLQPVPSFPEDDEIEIARLTAKGFTVKRKADHIEEWRRRHSSPAPAPRLRDLLTDLLPHLQVLEAHSVFSTRCDGSVAPAAIISLMAIARRTNDAICVGWEPKFDHGLTPGIDIVFGFGYGRPLDPDVLALRVEAWLSSEMSANLLESLDREEYGIRHAVLVFDSLEPLHRTELELAKAFVPRSRIRLPHPVGVVWCLLGSALLRYADATGWVRFDRGA